MGQQGCKLRGVGVCKLRGVGVLQHSHAMHSGYVRLKPGQSQISTGVCDPRPSGRFSCIHSWLMFLPFKVSPVLFLAFLYSVLSTEYTFTGNGWNCELADASGSH